MSATDLKARADSLLDIYDEFPDPGTSGSEMNAQRQIKHSTLRSVPIDHRYSYDPSRDIRKAWSAEITCGYCEDVDETKTTSRPAPPRMAPKSLAKQLEEPGDLIEGMAPHVINQQINSPLFSRLPPEIREQIWSHLLAFHGVILCITNGGLPDINYDLCPAVLATCLRILLEALPILYGRNRFSVFHIPNLMRAPLSPPRFTVCPRYFPFIRHLNIDIPDKFIDRWYYTHWGNEYESYMAISAALIRLAGPNLRHLQLSLVRNCALESYTSWGPYVAADSPLMREIATSFLPNADPHLHARGRKFVLLIPCGTGSGEAHRAFDMLRPDAPAVVHAVARNLGRLQKTAELNGVSLEDSLVVRVRGEMQKAGGELFDEATAQIVAKEVDWSGNRRREIALEVTY